MIEETNKQKDIAVLFSGGRDSSLAACILALSGYKVHLLSFINGLGVKGEISDFRFQELKSRLGEKIVNRTTIPIFGLVRRIAIENIENDFAKYKINLILLGEKLAMHAAAIQYCLSNGIESIADGTSGYQQQFAEQMPEAVDIFKDFNSEYGIQYLTPVISYLSEEKVKYTLFEVGISTKSLEGISIFADSFSKPTPEIAISYLNEKLPIARRYITFMLHGEVNE